MSVRESVARAIAAAPPRPGGIANSSISEVISRCPSASVVFEIGAYNGFDIPSIHQLWPDAAIHCFEPDPDNFARLKEFDSEFVPCHQLALSNREGVLPFYKALDSRIEDQAQREEWFKTAGSLLHQGPQHIEIRPEMREQAIDVRCTTVDHYCAERRVAPDILLMDTQGSEFEILEGASSTLSAVKVILLEWSVRSLYAGQRYLPEIQEFLDAFGFKMDKQIDLWSNIHGDAIFIRK